MKIIYVAFGILVCLSLIGCKYPQVKYDQVIEPVKVVWGSSTKALEDARPDATVKTYQCEWKQCFDAVLSIAKERNLNIFIADPKKPLIVLMGFSGSINTTEVGIFFTTTEAGKTKLEIVSLSPTAQETAVNLLSKELQKTFAEL